MAELGFKLSSKSKINVLKFLILTMAEKKETGIRCDWYRYLFTGPTPCTSLWVL